jgi:hypothetical protein
MLIYGITKIRFYCGLMRLKIGIPNKRLVSLQYGTKTKPVNRFMGYMGRPMHVFTYNRPCYKYADHVKWVPCHHGMARPQVADGGDGLQRWSE